MSKTSENRMHFLIQDKIQNLSKANLNPILNL